MGEAKTLRERFQEIEFCFGDPNAVFEQIRIAYSQPHRRYHTLQHVLEMLECLEQSGHLARDKVAVALAIWFHDAVYDVRAGAGGNEAASADLLGRVARGVDIDTVKTLILHSAHHGYTDDDDIQLFCDLDLYRLGAGPEEFTRHGDDIRFEYGYLADADWRKGRAQFLEQILARPIIFQTEYWRSRREQPARRNIAAAIAELSL